MTTALKDQGLKNYSTDRPCLACGKVTENGNTFHHILTRGSGGPDYDWNLMPLCGNHHTEIHLKGMTYFADKFPTIRTWLLFYKWEFNSFVKKWRRFA